MIHIIYHPEMDEVCLYDDEVKKAINADREFNHAMIRMLSNEIESRGKIKDFLRSAYCTIMAKLGKPQPEFFSKRVIHDTRSGTTYRIVLEIIPGGCDVTD